MNPTTQQGFTLIELMITVAIVAILGAVAYPAYLDNVRKGARAEAKNAVMDAASRQEKYFYRNMSYARTMTELGYNAATITTDSGRFQVTITAATPAAPNPATAFTITATAQGAQVDDSCDGYSVTNTGAKGLNEGDMDSCW